MIWGQHIQIVVLHLPDYLSNWNLEMLVFLIFEETKKPEYPKKSLSEQRIEPATNSTHIWRHRRDLNPGHTGGGRALSPLRHPLLPISHISIKIQPSMVHSDWLSYYQAICYSPLVARIAGFLAGKKGLKSSFNQLKLFCLNIFTSQLDFTKTILFLLPSWTLSQQPIWPAQESERNNC